METTSRVVAGICIFSLLIMGCYSSVVVQPSDEGNDRVYTQRIFYAVTHDGRKYEFDTAPTVANDTINGELTIRVVGGFMSQQVSIPLSDVALVSVKESAPVATAFLVVGILLFVGMGVVAATHGGHLF